MYRLSPLKLAFSYMDKHPHQHLQKQTPAHTRTHTYKHTYFLLISGSTSITCTINCSLRRSVFLVAIHRNRTMGSNKPITSKTRFASLFIRDKLTPNIGGFYGFQYTPPAAQPVSSPDQYGRRVCVFLCAVFCNKKGQM